MCRTGAAQSHERSMATLNQALGEAKEVRRREAAQHDAVQSQLAAARVSRRDCQHLAHWLRTIIYPECCCLYSRMLLAQWLIGHSSSLNVKLADSLSLPYS